ncbi:MAG: GAF domain-containing protein [Anaerolineales bacterium]
MKFLLKALLVCLACALVPLGVAVTLTLWGLPDSSLVAISIGLALVTALGSAGLLSREIRQARELRAVQEVETSRLRALADTTSVINSSLDLTTVLNEVLDAVIRLTSAERALLMLKNEQGVLQFRAARNAERKSLQPPAFPVSQTVVARVLENEEPVVATDARSDPRFKASGSAVRYHLRSIVCVPLKVKEAVTGVIYMDNRTHPDLFSERERDLLTAFANQAASAIENARLFEAVQRQLTQLSLLNEITVAAISAPSFDEAIMQALQVLKRRLGYEIIGLDLLDESGEWLHAHPSYVGAGDTPLPPPMRVTEGIVGAAVQSGRPVRVDDVTRDPRYMAVLPDVRSELAVPLKIADRVIGAINTDSRQLAAYSESDEQVLTVVAGLFAPIVENARLRTRAEQTALENATLYQALVERTNALQAAYNQLSDLDRLKDELVQNISHELRTPLTFMHSYVDLLLGGEFGPLQPEQEKSLRIVADKTDVLAHLVNDIITLQAVTPESLKLATLDLAVLARSAADGVAAVAQQAGVRLTVNLLNGPVFVYGDALRLAQVFDNLLGNALKYSEREGEIHLMVQPGRDTVRVEVRDTGIGISPEDLERIFDRFYQVSDARTRRRGGLGLGLAICKLIVEAHGGYIGVESQAGHGSCFYFTLPKQG